MNLEQAKKISVAICKIYQVFKNGLNLHLTSACYVGHFGGVGCLSASNDSS